jgi:hypothetical protein
MQIGGALGTAALTSVLLAVARGVRNNARITLFKPGHNGENLAYRTKIVFLSNVRLGIP